MSATNESLCQRILHDLNVIFKRDPQILEFDIIPIEDSVSNKSPVIHVDHRLGLESWCVRHLYQYIYHKFVDLRTANNRIGHDQINEWTRTLLLLNPDLTTVWSARKELIENGFIKVLTELRFSEVLLTRKPKSADNFAHRQWLLKYFMKSETLSDELITNELRVTLDTSSRYHRNYHSWSHRIWIIENLFNNSLDKLNCELMITKCWLESHVSDYSCYQYRQYLFQYIHKHFISITDNNSGVVSNEVKSNYHKLLKQELKLLNDLLVLYTDQESLFIHRRFILVSIDQWFANESTQLKESEKIFIKQQLSLSHSNNTSNQWHFILINRHIKYINCKLNWNLDIT
ncbi:protein prenyltransferase alpha subunit repeat-containing protein 1-B-like [Oppia nitens]|uniref:protein prenyltransferase alpha subunit repeat-containing protein 1-B-like n=1 Tax=Oppia nitens TaxID=1686743 RepID=UPI0023D99ABE|nr:protein prenyltransferase alpha subunit repeat-containing protein 1-B-like [Oppia nitens]